MIYPTLNVIRAQQIAIDTFGGYNHNLRPGDGEFYDILNMSADNFPVLSTRKARSLIMKMPGRITGMIEKDGIYYTYGKWLVKHGGEEYDLGLEISEKKLISMGAYIIILPDKKWFNTSNSEYGDIENINQSKAGFNVNFVQCTDNGDPVQGITYSGTEPAGALAANGALWMDTSVTPPVLRRRAEASQSWIEVAETFVKIYQVGLGVGFAAGDCVKLSGLKESSYDDLRVFDGMNYIIAAGDDYIVVRGAVKTTRDANDVVTISRKMPVMDFVTESNNRLWGCRYGTAENGEFVNEIYASKLGDFKNWNSYDGISMDSYTMSVGTDGPFTGAINFGGYPLFFKENVLHKIYGQIPANFQNQTLACQGVAKGSEESLTIVNNVLYYLGTSGVYAYDGSVPVKVSGQLGGDIYTDGVGGSIHEKYYLYAAKSGKQEFLVYDTSKGIWHKEKGLDSEISHLCRSGDALYASALDTLYAITGNVQTETVGYKDDRSWMAETGIIGASASSRKNLSKVELRMAMEKGSTVSIFAQYDSIGEWHRIARLRSKGTSAFTLPVKVKMCDHLRLRLEGDGECSIYAMFITTEIGSEHGGASNMVLDF